jgi:hypothetical protein
MAKLTLQDISSGYQSTSTYNANNTLIEAALENTLSLDGTIPNAMGVDLDMNSNQVTNLADGVNAQDAVTKAQLDALEVQLAAGNYLEADVNETVTADWTFSSTIDVGGATISDDPTLQWTVTANAGAGFATFKDTILLVMVTDSTTSSPLPLSTDPIECQLATYDSNIEPLWRVGFGATGATFEVGTDVLSSNVDIYGTNAAYQFVHFLIGDPDAGTDGTTALGNYVFDIGQTVGVGQDNYVLTYDNATGFITLEAAAAGGIANVVEDTTPQLGGTLDANGNTIDMGTNVITDAAVGQWDTAYGWGDHSTAGYANDKWTNVSEDVSDVCDSQYKNGVYFKDGITGVTLTLEASGVTTFDAGSTCAIINAHATTGDITVTEGAGTTLYYLDGSTVTDTAGGCTVGPGGYATLYRHSATVYYIMGGGITA